MNDADSIIERLQGVYDHFHTWRDQNLAYLRRDVHYLQRDEDEKRHHENQVLEDVLNRIAPFVLISARCAECGHSKAVHGLNEAPCFGHVDCACKGFVAAPGGPASAFTAEQVEAVAMYFETESSSVAREAVSMLRAYAARLRADREGR